MRIHAACPSLTHTHKHKTAQNSQEFNNGQDEYDTSFVILHQENTVNIDVGPVVFYRKV